MSEIRFGTSSWSEPSWTGTFYPPSTYRRLTRLRLSSGKARLHGRWFN